MSDTKTEEEPKRKEPEKKGLHGWKAATAVFGCGTLAAFGLFGVIVGVLSMVLSTASSGIQSSNSESNPVPTPGEPQASIEPGDLDLCSRNLPSAPQVSLMRVGAEDNYEDSTDDENRIVSDSCDWELRADYGTVNPWNLSYSYRAVISSAQGDRQSDASVEYDAVIDELGEDFDSVVSEGDAGFADRSYYVYGESSPGVSGYTLLAQTRSAIYEIKLEGESDSIESGALIPELPMQKEAGKIVRVSEIEFDIWIPGADD